MNFPLHPHCKPHRAQSHSLSCTTLLLCCPFLILLKPTVCCASQYAFCICFILHDMSFFNLLNYTWTFMTFLTRSRLLESHPGRFKPVKNDKSLANVIQFVWGLKSSQRWLLVLLCGEVAVTILPVYDQAAGKTFPKAVVFKFTFLRISCFSTLSIECVMNQPKSNLHFHAQFTHLQMHNGICSPNRLCPCRFANTNALHICHFN
jgi:hypothetical protein